MEQILNLNDTISKKIVNNHNYKKIAYFSSILYEDILYYNAKC